jgi:hypothetical protein
MVCWVQLDIPFVCPGYFISKQICCDKIERDNAIIKTAQLYWTVFIILKCLVRMVMV